MGDLFSWQIKENFFLFAFFLKPDKTVPKIPFFLKVLAWIMQKDVLWILLVKSYLLLEGNIFLWKGIIFCPFQRSIAFYAALYDRWEFSFKIIIMVIFRIFELSGKHSCQRIYIVVQWNPDKTICQGISLYRVVVISKLPIYRYDRQIIENIVISG